MAHNRFYTDYDFAPAPGTRKDRPDPQDDRSAFARDRDRIVFSYAFRRLQSKTQVFQSGRFDFYRTRLTHSIEVARIARAIADHLKGSSPQLATDFYLDPDLLEAVGMAHDLGHPPFGHIGERKLQELMEPWGGFEGNAQTIRIVTELFFERPAQPEGMQPSRAFLDGVMKYKALYGESFRPGADGQSQAPEHHFLYDDQAPWRDFVLGGAPAAEDAAAANASKSLECQIMDWADDTAYSLHDLVDGLKAGFLDVTMIDTWAEAKGLDAIARDQLEKLKKAIIEGYLEARCARRIGAFIRACQLEKCDGPMAKWSNRYRFRLTVDPRIEEECRLYKRLAFDLIFQSTAIQQVEFKAGHILERLHGALDHHSEAGPRRLRIVPEPWASWLAAAPSPARRRRLLCDFLSGLTDGQAMHLYKRLFDPDYGSVFDLR